MFLVCYILAISISLGLEATEIISSPTASTVGSEALWNNPSGLAFLYEGEAQASYLYEWHNQGNLHHAGGQFAFNFLRVLSLGAGLNGKAALSTMAKEKRDSSIQGIFGIATKFSKHFGFGISARKSHNFYQEKTNPFMFSFGMQMRPLNSLALGAHYQEVNTRIFSSPFLQAGISIKPYKDWFTLGLDGKWLPKSKSWDDGFMFHPMVSVTSSFSGYGTSLSLEFPKNGFSNPIFFLSFNVNFSHLGINVISLVNTKDNNYGLGGAIRASSVEWPSVVKKRDQWVNLSVENDGVLTKPPVSFAEGLFAVEPNSIFVLSLLKQIEEDKTVGGVLLKINGFSFGDAKAEEWRNALVSLRDAGKNVVVYLDSPSARDYYVATAANKIFMNEEATLNIGLKASLVYFADLLKNIGIKAESVVAGSYKTAPRTFTNSHPEKEELEVMNNILSSFYEQTSTETAKARNLNIDVVKALFDKGEITAKEALASGLVDKTVSSEGIIASLNNLDGFKKSFYFDYENRQLKQKQWQDPKKIVVIPIIGNIVDGYGSPNSFLSFSTNVYANDVVDTIEDSIRDPNILGILVRIDSPGGDVLASARMTNALLKAKKTKPVVVSMGDLAASGGYLVATAADKIFAQKNTITGSIGVFSLSFSGQELSKKFGIFATELSPIKNPGPSIFRPLSPKERELSQQVVSWYYENFINTVSKNLGLTYDETKRNADGRVWLGSEALERKLIHELGGFSDAALALMARANIKPDQEIIFEVKKPGAGKGFSVVSRIMGVNNLSNQSSQFSKLLKPYLHLLHLYNLAGKTQARLPYDIEWAERQSN